LIVAFLAAAPTLISVRYAGVAALVAVLTLWSWQAALEERTVTAGFLAACAASLKVYPLALFFGWLMVKRLRPVAWGVGFGLLLNLVGLSLPGVSLGTSFAALGGASETFLGLIGNGSMVRFVVGLGFSIGVASLLAAIMIGVLGVLLWLRGTDLRDETRMWGWVLLGLLIIPLSWISYDVVLYPLVGALAVSEIGVHRKVGLGVGAAWLGVSLLFLFASVDLGAVALVIRLLLLIIGGSDSDVTRNTSRIAASIQNGSGVRG
jgi:hypothetical protein